MLEVASLIADSVIYARSRLNLFGLCYMAVVLPCEHETVLSDLRLSGLGDFTDVGLEQNTAVDFGARHSSFVVNDVCFFLDPSGSLPVSLGFNESSHFPVDCAPTIRSVLHILNSNNNSF